MLQGAVKSNKQFEYVLKVESVRQYTVDALEKKGKVTDKKSEKDLGEIVDVQVEMQHCSQQQRRVNLKTLNCPEDILAM